ncbi:ADP-ribose pyrophosphatase [Clostridia bacterium]|nr:ADP-ribose pyrophosphatase [Clostridia bacterium]
MHLFEKRTSSEQIYNGRIINLTKDTVELENGEMAIREVVHHNGGVAIVPLLDDGRIILVKQFRYPYNEAIYEIPAGKLEKGENPLDCGMRELTEETGFTAKEFIFLGEVYPTPAYNTEIITLYLAKGLTLSKQKLDADEFLDIEIFTFQETIDMIMNNIIKDAKTQIALLKTIR